MRNASVLASCVLSGLIIASCGKSNDATTTTPPPAPPTGNAVSDGVKNATGALGDAAKNAQTTATDAANNAVASGSAATDMAKQKLAQVGDYIGQKKFDLADSTLSEVEKMKSSLPQTLQDQVTQLRTQLDAAKAANAAGGGNLPALPGTK
jgi:hypothetical protein